ncbi:MAG: hypothetical protein ACRBBO_05985 [Cognatishimia sp.]
MPLIAWGVLAVAGVYGAGWAAKETGEAVESTTQLTKWGIVAGGLYVGYRVAKSSGALK